MTVTVDADPLLAGGDARIRTRPVSIVRHPVAVESPTVEAFLEAYSPGIRKAASSLRAIVRAAVPDAIERVRPGWRLIGYEVPIGRRARYFAYVAPEPKHVHLGFEVGAWMADPQRLLEGAHLGLRKVRFVTFTPDREIPTAALVELTREAARLAVLPIEARLALAIDHDRGPDREGDERG